MLRLSPVRPKLFTTGLTLIGILLVFELSFIGLLYWHVEQAEREAHKARHVKTARQILDGVAAGYSLSAVALADYGITRSKDSRRDYLEYIESVEARLAEMEILARGNQQEEEQLDRLKSYAAKVTSLFNDVYEKIDERNVRSIPEFEKIVSIRRFRAQIRPVTKRIIDEVGIFMEVEEELYPTSPEQQLKTRENVRSFLLFGLACNILMAFGFGYVFIRGIAVRIRMISDNAFRLASDKHLNPVLGGDDELAHLDAVFHQMAAALKEAARKERAVIESAVDIICSIDREGLFRSVNPAVEAAWGYKPEEMEGTAVESIVSQSDREPFDKQIREFLSGKDSDIIECGVMSKSGARMETSWSVRWSDTDERLFCVVRDVTRAKQLERLKQDFLAMVTHDMRSPLFSAKSLLTLLEEGLYGELSEKGLRRIKGTHETIDRLSRLIDDLLDLEKLESGDMVLNKTPVQPQSLIEKASDTLASYAEKKLVKIDLECSIDDSFEVDEDRIIQVLVNLISNAVKFSPKQGVVTVKAVSGENHSSVEISVSDQGPGIPSGDLDHVFDRFRQVDGGEKTESGSGLGLAIVKAIVTAHGGDVTVESTVGEGSAFMISLPSNGK